MHEYFSEFLGHIFSSAQNFIINDPSSSKVGRSLWRPLCQNTFEDF
jgi:hypothetical protein